MNWKGSAPSLNAKAIVGLLRFGAATLLAMSTTLSAAPASDLVGPPPPVPPSEYRRVHQPVEDYFNVYSPKGDGKQKLEMTVNPFLAYTHLGSDFGFIGCGQDYIGWEPGLVVVDMPEGAWGGMWHGLAGVGDDMDVQLDFRACYPSIILPHFQPQIVGLELRARGKGLVKVDVKSSTEHTPWTHNFPIDSPDLQTFVQMFNPETVGRAKYLNWVAEGGTNACVDALGFIVQTPDIPFDEYVFLASYAKLARCYNQAHGLVSDRAHSRDGYFVNIPSSGLYCLCTALASSLSMVNDETARLVLHRTCDTVSKLEAPHGILPHFATSDPAANAGFKILPGTEYSTVDTAIYYHAMLLAAKILDDDALTNELTERIRGISFTGLTCGGCIMHGLRDDAKTVLPNTWHDWGGETALVLALNAMTSQPVPARMDASSHFHSGTGFIAELQSLFYRDFDSSIPDAMTGQNWRAARLELFNQQKDYFKTHLKDSPAAAKGYYGLSAGEGLHGFGYQVGGSRMEGQYLIHPHYVLMSASLENDPAKVYGLLRSMEADQLFPPWGLVEQFNATTLEYLPMQGALNAAFESLGAYHLLIKNRHKDDLVYDAVEKSALLLRGISVFYPRTQALTKS